MWECLTDLTPARHATALAQHLCLYHARVLPQYDSRPRLPRSDQSSHTLLLSHSDCTCTLPATRAKGEGFDVAKVGFARVALIGFPSVGKSSLLSALTDTTSEIASYEFTTLTCIPGNIM